ncbi:MAG: ABC transporter substrate-binding protein [Treponema sp.]|jgi:raffinose/stachyose/melibiose transport system substrate-binding protein|nr:ABC transporter substrate-binding protein [Treponema sp.]
MRKSVLVAMLFCLGGSLAFGAGRQSGTGTGVIEVTIPHYKSGQNVGGLFFLPQVERFNARYAGTYKLVIEELVQDMYNPKMQQLSQQGKLPVLIEGGAQEWLEEYIIPNNMYVDLKPWLDGKPELKTRLIPAALEYNTKNGRLFSIIYPVVRPMGIYYNAKLYQPSRPFSQMNWDQVMAELGNNKIAFNTSENSWTTMLVLSSLIAVQPGGVDWLRAGARTARITDFNTPIMINAVTKLQQILQTYASANTLGAAYADAANSFMSQRSALIANGSWMIGDFAPDASAKWSNGFNGADVHGDVFPGNVAIGGDGAGYDWWIPSTATQAEQELAKAFIEFIMSPAELEAYMLAEGGSAPRMQVSQEFLAERAKNRLMDEYSGAVNADTILSFSFESAVPTSIAEGDFGRLLPLLINGTMTPAQFCQDLTVRARETVR